LEPNHARRHALIAQNASVAASESGQRRLTQMFKVFAARPVHMNNVSWRNDPAVGAVAMSTHRIPPVL
jgi:hypothetical protein